MLRTVRPYQVRVGHKIDGRESTPCSDGSDYIMAHKYSSPYWGFYDREANSDGKCVQLGAFPSMRMYPKYFGVIRLLQLENIVIV